MSERKKSWLERNALANIKKVPRVVFAGPAPSPAARLSTSQLLKDLRAACCYCADLDPRYRNDCPEMVCPLWKYRQQAGKSPE